jgi:hypothetical protein
MLLLRRFSIAAALALALTVSASADSGEHVSTLADQRAVGVTIYNGDLAVVRDRRHITLPRGETHLALRDVSAKMQPQTAVLQSLGGDEHLAVVEQDFNYDLLTPQKLLEKYVGRDVQVVHYPESPGAPRRTERARILAANSGVVLRYGNRIETSIDGQLVYPSIPANLRDRPTLVTDLMNDRAGEQDVELDYLTGGLSWPADYTALLAPNDDRLDLRGLITLHNESGTSYTGASVQLVAGDVNVAPARGLRPGTTANMYSVAAAPRPKEEPLFEYHLYTLPRHPTVADAQTKQVELMTASAIPATTSLELRGDGSYYRSVSGDLGQRLKVGTYVGFRNEGGQLGIPLPAGTIRVYKRDTAGTAQFIGSDNIDHTPRGDTVRLYLGNAFDLVANKRQTDYKVVGENASESAYRIAIINGKAVAQDVLVVEQIPGDWRIVETSLPFVKSSANTATWTVRVPANGEAVLTYRARVTW